MASAALSRRVRKVVAYLLLCDMSDLQRQDFHEALLYADTFEDLPGRWQAAMPKAEENTPNLRIVGGDQFGGVPHTRAPDGERRSPLAWKQEPGSDRASGEAADHTVCIASRARDPR